MSKTQRRRAVVLALIAFFCTATYVAVDWTRVGGGFLAFFKGKGDLGVASNGGRAAGSNGVHLPDGQTSPPHDAALPQLASAHSRRHAAGGSADDRKPDEDDLFKYGNPAAGGIPPGSFVVAQNDAPPAVDHGDAGAPAPVGAPEAGGEGGGDGGGVTSPAPGPTGGSTQLGNGTGTSSPAPAPGTTPPVTSPTPSPSPGTPAPAPAPTQSGTTDPGDGASGTSPPSSLPPVSAIPEASSLEMMSLGALFVAVAATRRRKAR